MENNLIKIGWFGKHFGEEPPLVGSKNQGAGGIFFSGCNLRCVFCQNYQISQKGFFKKEYSIEELADIMLELQSHGAINIDLVSPTIWASSIKKALTLAKKQGLNIPIVWNSNAYEAVALLKEMEGLVDIYLPDFKYGDDEVAQKYSGAKKYTKIAVLALKEMLRQAGPLEITNEIANKGVIIRHLVLPNNLQNSFKALEIIARLDKNIPISLMSQYYPLHEAEKFPEINKPVSKEGFQQVFDYAQNLGFTNGWVQQGESCKSFVPDFTKAQPFV